MASYSIGVIGPGRLGRALLYAAQTARHQVAFVSARHSTALQSLKADFPEAKFLQGVVSPPPADVIFLTVPDDVIPETVQNLAENASNLRATVVAHTSGAKSSVLLEALRDRGALVASFHPAQSFAGLPEDWKKFRGTTVAMEGDAGAVALLAEFARSLGGRPLKIPTEAKPLYHLACVMANNYSTALLDSGLDILEKIGIPRPKGKLILLPLLQTTATNLKEADPEQILTGPIARGDVQTVEEHLKALAEQNPAHLATYIALGRETLHLARKLAPQKENRYQEIDALFSIFEKKIARNS